METINTLWMQYGPTVVALAAGALVKWWNKKQGTAWHNLLSPLAALAGSVLTAMVNGQDLALGAAQGGAAAVAIQSTARGVRMMLEGRLKGSPIDRPTVSG